MEVLEGNLLDRPFLDRAMAGVSALFLATFSDHDGTEVRGSNRVGSVVYGWVETILLASMFVCQR